MSALKDKSEFNTAAATTLIAAHMHAPSVHCSYYSCVQLMLYIIYYKERKDKEAFALDARNSRKGTHGHAIYHLSLALARKGADDPKAREDWKQFQKDITNLKALCEKADYGDAAIDGKDSGMAKALATATNNILKRRFP